MKKMIHKNILPKSSISSYNGIALLLCTLIITGCGDKLIPKAFVFDMTRLNQDGSVNDGKDYAKQPWACVRDNQSGLIWEVKKSEAGLRNINNTYSWYDSDPNTNGGWPGKANAGICTGSDCDSESYIKAINAIKLCGLNDWYLPSRFELNTIVDISVLPLGPTFPKSYFPETMPGKYWTDTTFSTRRAGVWIWNFESGSDYVTEKSEAHSIRLTHASPKKPDVEAVKK